MAPNTNQDMQHLPSVTHVADYMLATAALDHDIGLDELQLNKLLYLVNGFVLQERDQPAFHNPIEAWKYGPVIRMVRETYGRHEGRLKMLELSRTSLADREAVAKHRAHLLGIISRDVAEVVGGVLDQYGRCTGGELVDMTHRNDTPWKAVYQPGFNRIIPTNQIAVFYRRLNEHNAR